MPTTRKSPAAQALAELDDLNFKLARGQRLLQRLKDEDVQIATADKEVVFREDKTTLYRYKPVTEQRAIDAPVLVAYGQVGRNTMTDLQEDRSMLRNLLALGVDVYAVDWGSPTRGDRWLTFEDYVDVYLADWRRAHLPRGESSDLLSAATVAEMQRRGRAELAGQVHSVEVAGCHAPSLMEESQIAVVRGFLLGDADRVAAPALRARRRRHQRVATP